MLLIRYVLSSNLGSEICYFLLSLVPTGNCCTLLHEDSDPLRSPSLLLSTRTHELYGLTLQIVHNYEFSLNSELTSPLGEIGLNVYCFPVNNNKTYASRTRHYFCVHRRHKRIIFKKKEGKVWTGLIWYSNYSAFMMFRFFKPALTRAPLSVYSFGPLINCSS